MASEPDDATRLSAPFPLHCLPPDAEAIARACVDVYGVPPTLAGCCVLGVLSASIGTGLQVRSLADRFSRANLYLLATAESGSGKSETFRTITMPFFEFQDSVLEAWKRDALPKLKAEEGALKSEISTLESAFKRKRRTELSASERDRLVGELADKQAALLTLLSKLHPPVFYVEDTTEQRLESLMQQRGETLACLSDDARQVTDNLMGRNRGGGEVEDGFWVKAWTGGRHKVDRANGRNVLLKNPCLSALIFVQDDKLRAMLARPELSEGGFLPRALPCRTGCEPQKIDRSRGRIPQETTEAWNHLVLELLNDFRQALAPHTCEPSRAAEEIMDAHFNELVPRRRIGGDLFDVSSFAARWTEQAWRIGVCIHAGLYGGAAAEQPFAKETAECALELAEWFADQQIAILADNRGERRMARLTQLRARLSGYGGAATLRDLSRNNGFSSEEVRALAEMFPSQLGLERRETGGRPSETAFLPLAPGQSGATLYAA